MLSRFDDYPIHQTSEAIAHPASSDRNVYDRYWFNGYADDGEYYLGVGMAVYPHRDIIDCGFSFVRDGMQYAFHASARAPAERGESVCGPFRIDIVEPMLVTHFVLGPNETGIEADLTFTARTSPIEEGRQTMRQGARIIMDSTRFAQFGRWHGRIRYDGKELAVDAARTYGTKDRSWGIRPVGEPDAGAPARPGGNAPGVYFLWSPIHWKDRCTHFGLFERPDGTVWHFDGAVSPVYDASYQSIPLPEDPAVRHMKSGSGRVVYAKGTRQAKSAELTLVSPTGESEVIQLEPLLLHRMKGLGYMHHEWGHGRWKGELAMAGESWKCADADPLALDNLHIQQVMRARSGDREGIGVLEQLCIGPHAPSGFKEYFDGAS
ncbi:MAG: hypothetical protein FJ144_19100 [Deltaproteobacteria bacterium]|nr:hypothetical protein [Deltaproteobacteria bacterium]